MKLILSRRERDCSGAGREAELRKEWGQGSFPKASLLPAGPVYQGARADQDHHGLDTGLPSRAAAGLDPGPGWLGEAPDPSPTPLRPLGLPEPTSVALSDSGMHFLTCLINSFVWYPRPVGDP